MMMMMLYIIIEDAVELWGGEVRESFIPQAMRSRLLLPDSNSLYAHECL